MKNRIKKLKSPAVKTRAEMETLVREIAGLKLNEKLLVDNMDAEIQDIRDCYQSRFNTITQVLADKLEVARAWAEKNPGEFGQRKSIEFAHGTIGFRTGKPKLKNLTAWDWDRTRETLPTLSWGKPYLRVKEEINKEQILADIASGVLSAVDLLQAGAFVVQDENFYAESKLTHTETREVARAA